MSLPIAPNTTCDVYHVGTAPPGNPAIAGVPCFLRTDWRGGQEAGDRSTASPWTHVMLIEPDVDIRDAYVGGSVAFQQDTVCIPDKNGTLFVVAFIERVQRNTPHEHKRVFLDRQQPFWPSNNL